MYIPLLITSLTTSLTTEYFIYYVYTFSCQFPLIILLFPFFSFQMVASEGGGGGDAGGLGVGGRMDAPDSGTTLSKIRHTLTSGIHGTGRNALLLPTPLYSPSLPFHFPSLPFHSSFIPLSLLFHSSFTPLHSPSLPITPLPLPCLPHSYSPLTLSSIFLLSISLTPSFTSSFCSIIHIYLLL